MHLDISLLICCHKPLIVVLEPEWSNDSIFGDGNPGSALLSVMAFADSAQGYATQEDVVLRVHLT